MKPLNEAFEYVAKGVQTESEKKNILRGVFAMGCPKTGEIRYCSIGINRNHNGIQGKPPVNLIGCALCKYAGVAVRGTDTNETQGRNIMGEVPWKGGIIGETGEFIYCITGSDEDTDLELAKFAEKIHQSL